MAKKILLVDDAAFMRKVIKDTLSKAGYTDLHEAVDGADAVEKYNHGSGEHGYGRGPLRRQGFHCQALQAGSGFEDRQHHSGQSLTNAGG